ncbi:MAG: hypothetical protein IPL28_11585 [Chloroflexi bacterium]|nr:hypothetical protein [Chloroflexota bacterium]
MLLSLWPHFSWLVPSNHAYQCSPTATQLPQRGDSFIYLNRHTYPHSDSNSYPCATDEHTHGDGYGHPFPNPHTDSHTHRNGR